MSPLTALTVCATEVHGHRLFLHPQVQGEAGAKVLGPQKCRGPKNKKDEGVEFLRRVVGQRGEARGARRHPGKAAQLLGQVQALQTDLAALAKQGQRPLQPFVRRLGRERRRLDQPEFARVAAHRVGLAQRVLGQAEPL